jgi:SAM-dependent methyltransferase
MERAGAGMTGGGASVRWEPGLLLAEPRDAAKAFARSIQGYSRRLVAPKRARFVMELDTPIHEVQNLGAMDVEGQVHPKHRLTRYHEFFVDRIRAGERVLDLGCGYGAVAISIVQRAGATVTGMDWSETNLAQARAEAHRRDLGSRLSLVQGDITHERAPGRFDVVMLSNVLEHLMDREALLARYREWYRPRILLVRVPAIDRDWQTAWKRELGVDYRCDDTHETEYTEEQLRAELGSAGWRVTELIARWGEYWAAAEPG